MGILFLRFAHIIPGIHNIFAKLIQSHGLLLRPTAQKFRSIPGRKQRNLLACPTQNEKPALQLDFHFVSGHRESNPDLTVPNRIYYHYTMPRFIECNFVGEMIP